MNKILVVIPTYNEATNVPLIYKAIKALKIKNLHILFIDDTSPDGTYKIVTKFMKKDKYLSLIKNPPKNGLGSAHIDGIKYGYKNKFDILITMDADLTHNPKDILRFIKKTNANTQIIVGSRYKSLNAMKNWSIVRKIISFGGHEVIKLFLGIKEDSSNAFRLYNLKNINKNIFNLISSKDYAFFLESAFIFKINNIKINEIGVNLKPRQFGKSKTSIKNIINRIRKILYLSLDYRLHPQKYII